ncbi:unnamed protein product [Onchocerca flexuosa]|uniref:40S ribosomal protein S26 n=1 Tax=Onchocerca flexuosa TaxID=387005 RepID=A0A183I8M6_9BILA|nr:unnamed protein product [Onchocerca flexuosa]
MSKKLNKCTTNCGLDLPPDSVLVKTVKNCTQRSGLQTSSVQELCFCVEKAGIRLVFLF